MTNSADWDRKIAVEYLVQVNTKAIIKRIQTDTEIFNK